MYSILSASQAPMSSGDPEALEAIAWIRVRPFFKGYYIVRIKAWRLSHHGPPSVLVGALACPCLANGG